MSTVIIVEVAMPIRREYVAKKPHTCNSCKKDIAVGDGYIQWVTPPWNDYEADVDDDGRTIGFLRDRKDRHWYTERYHFDCIYGEYSW